MSIEKQQDLVAVIRGTHEKLKMAYSKSGDHKQVWNEHLSDCQLRKKYAEAMLKLATEFWKEKDSRINWCYEISINYFFNGGLKKYLERDRKNSLNNLEQSSSFYQDCLCLEEAVLGTSTENKLLLLDVGSCYNPFSKYSEFISFAIDITPATKDVHQGDFLQINVIPKPNTSDNSFNLPKTSSLIQILYQETFHIVVFSLVLEYLPSAEQRLLFCQKAWQLLKCHGLLLIITPDSKSQHHNVPMIKSWNTALQAVGFRRIVYEKKKHLHCIGYRKIISAVSDISKIPNYLNLMYIPQDFKVYSDAPVIVNRTDTENETVRSIFCELPLCNELF